VGKQGPALVQEIARIVAQERVDEVIVGLPVTMSGGESNQTGEVRAFVASLRSALPVPVTEADERLSSSQAAGALRGREKARSGQRDSAAAAIVLQSILDRNREVRP
jgi:putative holliday junction resolvase